MLPIKCDVRQGCILSSDLFLLYSEILIRFLNDLKGVSIGGRNIYNLGYADDSVLLVHTEDLQTFFKMNSIIKANILDC